MASISCSLGTRSLINETTLPNGALYKILKNKATKGRKDTKAETVITILEKIQNN